MRMWYESRYGHTSFNLMALLFKLFHGPLKAREHMEKMALVYRKWTLLDCPKAIELLHILKNVLPSTQIEVKLSWLCIMTHWIALNSFFGWLFAIDGLQIIVLIFFFSLLRVWNYFIFIWDFLWPTSLMSCWAAQTVQQWGLQHAVTFIVVTDDIICIVVIIIII